MNTENIEKMSGHWLLAKAGKKVLRPGGKHMTERMIEMLNISSEDNIVEFAPGLGLTAGLALNKNPKSYIGIDAEDDAIDLLNKKFKMRSAKFIHGNASYTNLPEQYADKVYGEAMLTMHADHRKSEIIREARRILKSKGIYAVHELALIPDSLEEKEKAEIQKNLAVAIKVNARPLTITEWSTLLEKEGFRILKVETSPMHLLEPARMISDETFPGFLKIMRNVIMQPDIRSRLLQMRRTFRKYENHLRAVSILAQKI